MRKLLSAALAVAAWGLVGGPVGSSPAAAETIKIAHSTWVGYGPLYIARDRGFFKNHGAEVELTVMEDPKLRFTRSEEHTSELQSRLHLVCRLLLEKKKRQPIQMHKWVNST